MGTRACWACRQWPVHQVPLWYCAGVTLCLRALVAAEAAAPALLSAGVCWAQVFLWSVFWEEWQILGTSKVFSKTVYRNNNPCSTAGMAESKPFFSYQRRWNLGIKAEPWIVQMFARGINSSFGYLFGGTDELGGPKRFPLLVFGQVEDISSIIKDFSACRAGRFEWTFTDCCLLGQLFLSQSPWPPFLLV